MMGRDITLWLSRQKSEHGTSTMLWFASRRSESEFFNRLRRLVLGVFLAALITLAFPAKAQADFGIQSMSAGVFEEDGSVDLKAGSHPYEFKFGFVMNQNGKEEPEGTLRDLILDLPAGMVGNPFAVPRCTAAEFQGQTPHCPGDTQIGVARVRIVGLEPLPNPVDNLIPIYNLTPPFGVPASVGFSIVGFNSFTEASLRPTDYGARVADITIPTSIEIQSVQTTIWGTPVDPGHNPERFCRLPQGGIAPGCKNETTAVPFLTLPTSCAAPLQWTLSIDSVQEPDVFQTETVQSTDDNGTPTGLSGCEGLPFAPQIDTGPETATSDSPTGLGFHLKLPQNEDPQQQATAHLKAATVTLPAGLALNPSTADGRGACPLTGPEGINLPGSGEPGEAEPAKCPANSEVGTVLAHSPLVDHPVKGTVYLARQSENPFGSLFALYIAFDDPQTGVVVKLAGRLEPDPVSGQLKTTFPNNPQLPLEDFEFQFPGGSRAPLTTPPTCGTYTTAATLTPWSAPQGKDATPSDSFPIGAAPGGGPCAPSESQMPNAPSFEAGTAAPLAGAYSPFVMKLARQNGSQRFGAVNLTLPPGLTAKFAGVAECSEAQIAVALARSGPGQGSLELASPSCPAASELGTVDVGAGSGAPFHVGGKVYLAGPYKGAPFSLAIITPAIAGPFDIGTVVVRAALYVNEETGQGTVRSDPLPRILEGIPLDVREVTVKIDRNAYVLNPTSCEAKQISGEAISTTGQAAPLTNRFQVGGCKGLDYTPKLSLQLKGATRRDGHPALKSVLTQPSGQANARRIVVILPPTEFIDPLRTANPCTRPAFAEGKCPPASVLGTARVFTPLLDKPLEGPVYFRANGGARELPDAVADLHGQVHLVLVGFVDAVHRKGSESSRVRTTFANVPDAPVAKAIVELKGGKKGVLVNSANLCKTPPIATVKMSAQNNKALDQNQRIATSCKNK